MSHSHLMLSPIAIVLFLLAPTLALQPAYAARRCRHHHRLPVPIMLTEQEERVSAAMEIKPVEAESARSSGLALALDDGTRKSHSMAENTAFVTGFFKGS